MGHPYQSAIQDTIGPLSRCRPGEAQPDDDARYDVWRADSGEAALHGFAVSRDGQVWTGNDVEQLPQWLRTDIAFQVALANTVLARRQAARTLRLARCRAAACWRRMARASRCVARGAVAPGLGKSLTCDRRVSTAPSASFDRSLPRRARPI